MLLTRVLWSAVPMNARPAVKRLVYSRVNPANWVPLFKIAQILGREYGFLQSVARRAPVDANGSPLPWYTYPAIEYLKQIDFSDAAVFEFGAGHSTLFWSAAAASVNAVEDNPEWYRWVQARAPAHCSLLHEPDYDRYADAILEQRRLFDVIVIDGGDRHKCAQRAVRALRPGGLVILDNSDWAPESSWVLRSAGLLEVDMTGFSPGTAYTGCTSFYFHRAFSRLPKGGRQPQYGIGAKRLDWERTLTAERLHEQGRGIQPGVHGDPPNSARSFLHQKVD